MSLGSNLSIVNTVICPDIAFGGFLQCLEVFLMGGGPIPSLWTFRPHFPICDNKHDETEIPSSLAQDWRPVSKIHLKAGEYNVHVPIEKEQKIEGEF